jgi:hypothetical protein
VPFDYRSMSRLGSQVDSRNRERLSLGWETENGAEITEGYYSSVVYGDVSRDRAFLSLCNVALGEPNILLPMICLPIG